MNDSRQPDPTTPQGLSDDPSGDVTRIPEAPGAGGETRVKNAPVPDTHSDLPGGAAERYRLGAVLARGGMGVVYRAEDLALGREVAVKVLRPELARSSAAGRFRAEARITGQLQHPSIPPVHDLGALPDGRPFLAMKLIKGRTLAEEIKARPFTTDDLDHYGRVFEQVCLAVAFAHSRGVIHRDLKPANIMVGVFGEVQVMDWGLAKAVVRGEQPPIKARDTSGPVSTPTVFNLESHVGPEDRTEVGEVLGTPAYMPPEQIRGPEVDERTDVFALGGILCAVLTGKPPYVGKTGQEVWKNASAGSIEDAIARLERVTGAGQFRAIARRCLHLNPAQRYAHAGEVAAAVHAARAKARDVARRDELSVATEEADRRRAGTARWARLAVVFGVAGLALAVIGMITAGVAVDYAKSANRQAAAEREKLDAEHHKDLFPVLVAAAHRLADEGAFNPAADRDRRARFVQQLQQSEKHLAPTDATHVQLLLCGLFLIGMDDETARGHWDRAVEHYKALAPDHTETALAVQAGSWCAGHKPPSKMDLAVMKRVNSLLRSAAVDPSIPADLRKQAAALVNAK